MSRAVIRQFTVMSVAASACIGLAACGSQGKSNASNASASTGSPSVYGAYGGSGSSSSSGSSPSPATAAGAGSLRLARTSRGKILVSSRGFTAYLFTADRRNRDRCVKVSGCTSAWPPLIVKGRPSAGSGVKRSLLATIKLGNGHHQLTYAGHPLYGYTGDSTPASTGYIGATSFGGAWLAVNAAGKAVH